MSYTTPFLGDDRLQQQFPPPHPHYPLSQTTPTSYFSDYQYADLTPSTDYFHTLALLQRNPPLDINAALSGPQASSSIAHHTRRKPTSAPTSAVISRQDSAVAGLTPEWMYSTSTNSMGGPIHSSAHTGSRQGLKRQRTHQRTPSASTIGSNEPSSPYDRNTLYPHIANTEVSPNSPLDFAEQAHHHFSKNPSSAPQQYSTNLSPSDVHFQNAHLAMKGFAIDHHHSADEYPPEFTHSSRQSMSSNGQNSPATPRSASDNDMRDESYKVQPNGLNNANPSFLRTESAAYQDELYNPANFSTMPIAAQSKPSRQYLSPHRSLVHDRLQTANLARSASPTSAASRERSPFRQGSPLAPTVDGWNSNSPRQAVGTASGMRQQQKEEAEQAEYAQHRPSLQREPTKTISPKDAVLDYNGSDEPSLFQDSVPTGYAQHFGGAEPHTASLFSQPGAAFEQIQQHMTNFRATSSDAFAANDFNFQSPQALPNQQQISQNPFATQAYQATTMNNMNSMNAYPATTVTEATPEFRPTLTSMESSLSDTAMGLSSQGSFDQRPVQRPNDPRANTGTYTCTYHGCAHRFDSHANLQKHKRDYHRSQAQQAGRSNDGTSTDTASPSPRSTESPAPSTSGMTSAALLARNSQAGPHKCTRINPSTNKPCNTIFSRPYDLTRHEDTIHNNRKQKVRCPMCREEKTFSRNDALTRHMRVVHPEVESFGKRGRRGD